MCKSVCVKVKESSCACECECALTRKHARAGVCIGALAFVHACMRLCVCVRMYACICVSACMFVCARVYVCVCVCVCVCACVRVRSVCVCAFSDANMCLKLLRPRVGSMSVLSQEIVPSYMLDCSLVEIEIVRTPTSQWAGENLHFTAKPRLVDKGVECLSCLRLGRNLRSPKSILCKNWETEFEAVDCHGNAQHCQYIVDGIDERH